jgi:hypothetical protein
MTGWPFLIARGRRRGYSVLLAPDFLVVQGEYGFLEDVVGPTRSAATIRTASAGTRGGRPVCLLWTEHRVTAADLGGAGEGPADEHSRPLDLLHGVLLPGTRVVEAARADLDHTRRAALETYRRFLADEEDFTVAVSSEFATATTVEQPPAAVPPSPAHRVGVPVLLALSGVVVFFGLRWLGAADPPPPPPPPPPTTCTLPAVPTTTPRPVPSSTVRTTTPRPVPTTSTVPTTTSDTCAPTDR